MPKEGFHISLAENYLTSFPGNLPAAVRNQQLAFLIGALSPDIFFYDLPTFSQSRFGNALHSLMEREGIAPILNWLESDRSALSETCQAWALGFAGHFLADAIWHPVINSLSLSNEVCCGGKLSPLNCHRFLECEMEAYRLTRTGSAAGYVYFLDAFRRDRGRLDGIATCYRRFLQHASLSPVPLEKKILECYLRQNFLLRIFVSSLLGRQRDRLLAFGPTRYLGALVVPARPVLPPQFFRKFPEEQNPFSDRFVERWITSLSSLFSELPGRH